MSRQIAPQARVLEIGTPADWQALVTAAAAIRSFVLDQALAAAISDSTAVAPEVARLQGIALAAVFPIIITDAGRRSRDGQSQAEIADELRPQVENILDELDRSLTVPAPTAPQQPFWQRVRRGRGTRGVPARVTARPG